MEDILKEAAKQVPSLAVLVGLVVFFLRSQAQRDTAFLGAIREQRADHMGALATRDAHGLAMAQDCHMVTEASTKAMQENSRVLGRADSSLDAVNAALVESNRILRGKP